MKARSFSEYKSLRRLLEHLHSNEVACGIGELNGEFVLYVCRSDSKVACTRKLFTVYSPKGLVLFTSPSILFIAQRLKSIR